MPIRRPLCAAALLMAAGLAHAQCLPDFLNAGDPQTAAYNGSSLAMQGAYFLAGAPGKTNAGHANAGEVYAYSTISGTWGQVTHLLPNDPTTSASFGASVGIGGGQQWAVIGAPGAGGGAAYIFRRNTSTNLWSQVIRLDPGYAAGSHTGKAVAMNTNGDIAVVGCPDTDVTDIYGTTAGAGTALVYVRNANNTWSYQANLHQWDPAIRHASDGYGAAVACDDNTIVVGVPTGDSPSNTNCGYIHIWTRDANNVWTGSGEIYAPSQRDFGHFGQSVAIRGNTIVVGYPSAYTLPAGQTGEACTYRKINGVWTLDQELLPTELVVGMGFGAKVSVSDQWMSIGDYTTDQRVHLFRVTPSGQWVQAARYFNPTPSGDAFGGAVATDGPYLVAGAPNYDTPNYAQSGCAYLYDTPIGCDTCEGAIPVTGTIQECNWNCTVDGSSSCDATLHGADIWYLYQAPATGQVTINTQGSALDTILSVHSACPGTQANTIACNDDSSFGQLWSRVTIPVTHGTTYMIRIAGYGGAQNAFTLNIGGVVPGCYANCDNSTAAPILNVADFSCFLNKFAAGDPAANCDGSTTIPTLNVADFSCFLNRFAAGCS